jgi:regulator of replication initiation timing
MLQDECYGRQITTKEIMMIIDNAAKTTINTKMKEIAKLKKIITDLKSNNATLRINYLDEQLKNKALQEKIERIEVVAKH